MATVACNPDAHRVARELKHACACVYLERRIRDIRPRIGHQTQGNAKREGRERVAGSEEDSKRRETGKCDEKGRRGEADTHEPCPQRMRTMRESDGLRHTAGVGRNANRDGNEMNGMDGGMGR